MSAGSTFAERFAFSRDVQAHSGRGEDDRSFAEGVGVKQSAVTDYKQRKDPPPAHRALDIALRCGVDPGWLVFGAQSQAPAPDGFEKWLTTRREEAKKHAERKRPAETEFRTRSASKTARVAGRRR